MALVATVGPSKRYPDGSGRAETLVTVVNDVNGNVVGAEMITYTPAATVQESVDLVSAIARAKVESIKAQNAGKAGPLIPSGTTLDLTPPSVPSPTQAQLDRAQWFADFQAERTQQVMASLSPALQSRYRAEFGAL